MDEFPSGASGGMTGAPPSEEDFSKMPIEQRLTSKVWKARLSAYTELSSAFSRSSSEQDPIFKPYTRNPDLLKSMVLDANAVAQEKATETLKAFVEFGGKAAGKTRETVLPSIVEKCLGSARAGTKKNALEIVLLYVEMEDIMASEGPVEDVCAGLKAKQPKLVASCVTALKDMIKAFGPKQVSPKPILKVLPTIFSHSDKTVRAEGSLLAQELHRYIGAALEPTIDTLKDIQAKELRAQFEELDKKGEGKPVPERYILSEKIKAEEAAAAAAAAVAGGESAEGVDAGEDEGGDEIDAFDLAEPIDPFKSKEFPSNFDELLASKKWQERIEGLEGLGKALNSSPKLLMNNGYDSVIDQLTTKIAKDSNINVVLECCRCIESMAKGLRSNFSKYKEKVLPPILEKLKEKKASTVEVLAKTLDSVFQTVTFSDVLEDIFSATKHKNPNVKTEAIKFLVRCLRTTRTPPSKGDIKPIAETLVNALGDANADVRDAGVQGLGTLMKLVGERMMNQFLEGLDDIKKGKIQEEFKVATVKAKMGGPAATASGSSSTASKKPGPPAAKPKVAAPSSGPAPRKPLLGDKENESPAPKAPATGKPPARLTAKKPAAAAAAPAVKKPAAASASSSKPAAGGKTAAAATEPVKYRFSSEDAEARAAELIPANISTQIASGVWKDRLAGMTELLTWLQGEVENVESEVILRSLAKKPGWKESNFQVLSEVYKVLQLLAEQCPAFGRSSIALSVQPLCDKLGDIKLKGPAGETLNIYAEKTSFGFVLAQALGPLASLKAPKAIADSLLWVDQSLLDFGTTGVDMRGLIDHLITCLKSANAGVRTNATKVIGTISRFIGPAINTFLGDLNSQLKTTVEAEIEKASSLSRPEPTKFGAEHKAPAASGSKGGNGGGASASAAAEEDALDDLIPRVDLDKLVPSSILTRLGDANWKERKEALEELQGILEANQRLKPNMTELVTPLKLRYADSNVAVRTLALDVISRIATAMNKGFEQHARTFVPPVAQVLADAKAPIRASASAALTAIAEQVGAGPMIPGFAHQLDAKSANPMLRQELFTWMGDWFSNHPPEKPMDLAPLAPSAVLCLDDKLAAVRKAAQAVLPYIILRAGFKFVSEQTGQLKAASRTSVTPLLDAARTQAQAMAPSKTAPAPAAAPAVSKTPAVKKPAVVAAAAPDSSSSNSPPTSSPSPRASGIFKPAGKQPVASAAMRSLKAPGTRPVSRIDSDDLDSRGLPAPGFKSKLGGLKKSGMASSSTAPASTSSSSDRTPPFLSSDGKGKALRERKEPKGQHWISSEGTPRPELMDTLRSQAEPHLSQSLSDSMFSKDHNAERDYLSALSLLTNFIGTPNFPEEEYGLTPADAVARIVANSDLVFKYIAIRLTDNNTSITIKCLDVLDHLVELLRSDQYHMNDYEANSILPCLVAKFGDAKTQFRDRIREIFRHLTFVFPPSKLLTYYIDCGLPSKNARTRTECLSELGYLFARNGLQVCTPAKTLPIIGKQIADRDTNVRTAALMTLGEAYKIVGDDVWKLIGPLPAKDRSLLEERLKRTTTGGSSSAPAAGKGSSIARPGSTFSPPTGTKASTGSTSSPTSSKIASRLARPSSILPSGIPPPKSKIAGPSGIRAPSARASDFAGPEHEEDPGNEDENERRPRQGQGQDVFDDDEDTLADESEFDRSHQSLRNDGDDIAVEQSINEMLSSDWERSISAIKELKQDVDDAIPCLARHADRLVIATGKQLKKAFPEQEADPAQTFRLKKHILALLLAVFATEANFEERTLASYMTRSGLVPILTELLQCLILVSDRSGDPNSPSYSKQINSILLRSFSSTNLNTLFASSLSILMEATEDLPSLKGQILEKRVKFAELMVKCQWKFGKRLPNAFKDNYIDPQQLLVDIESFLQVIPPAEWRKRHTDGTKLGKLPFTTIKRFIEDIVAFYGEESLSMLEAIENPDKSFVYTYLYRGLNQESTTAAAEPELAQAPEVAPGPIEDHRSAPASERYSGGIPKGGHTAPGDRLAKLPPVSSPPLPTSPPTSSSDDSDTSHSELNSIFQRISHKEESRLAIKDLYDFQKRYPHKKDTSVARALAETGPIFQRYIKRALANLEREDPDAAPPVEDDKRASTISSVRDSIRDSRISESARSSIMNSEVPSSPSARQSLISNNGEAPGTPTSGSRIRHSANDERLAALKAKFGSPTNSPGSN